MKLSLCSWRRRWQSVVFDTETGHGSLRWFSRRSKHNSGWAFRHKGTWYAILKAHDEIVFQAGRKSWSMSEKEYSCKNKYISSHRQVCISRKNEKVFELEYRPYDDQSDPTFDHLDLETKDFFYWVCLVWNDPIIQSNLIKEWSKDEN